MAKNNRPMERQRSVKFSVSKEGSVHASKPPSHDTSSSSDDDEIEPSKARSGRFRVAAVDGSNSMRRPSLPGRRTSNEDGSAARRPTLFSESGPYDSANTTFDRTTLESLPNLDHYRNLFTTTDNGRSRPTLMELHNQEMQVSRPTVVSLFLRPE